jgi:phosphoglycolate phosphatase-like HAD superfamily hydrolase
MSAEQMAISDRQIASSTDRRIVAPNHCGLLVPIHGVAARRDATAAKQPSVCSGVRLGRERARATSPRHAAILHGPASIGSRRRYISIDIIDDAPRQVLFRAKRATSCRGLHLVSRRLRVVASGHVAVRRNAIAFSRGISEHRHCFDRFGKMLRPLCLALAQPVNMRNQTSTVTGKAVVKLVVFDIDGTLLDNLESEDACYAAALNEGLGLAALDTDWRSYEHVTDQGVAVEAYRRAFGVAPSAERIDKAIDRFLMLLTDAHAREPLRPVSGAADLLAALPGHGWLPALATGAWRRAARYKLAAAGLQVNSLPLATAEDGPSRVAIVQAAWTRAESKSSPFERVVLVGDGVWDVAAGIQFARPWFGGNAPERRFERIGRWLLGIGILLSGAAYWDSRLGRDVWRFSTVPFIAGCVALVVAARRHSPRSPSSSQ